MANDVGRAAHLAESFRRMVAQAAWSSWRRLPAHTRVWVSIDDMVSDGMWFLVSEAIPKWSEKRGSLSTFIYVGVHNFYNEHYYHKLVHAKARNERLVLSLDELAAKVSTNSTELAREQALELALTKRHDYRSAEQMQQDCFVVPLMLQVYRDASENLQHEIRHWFLGEGGGRFCLKNHKFLTARKEFRKLAKKVNLDIEDCRHLLASPDCMGRFTREIVLP